MEAVNQIMAKNTPLCVEVIAGDDREGCKEGAPQFLVVVTSRCTPSLVIESIVNSVVAGCTRILFAGEESGAFLVSIEDKLWDLGLGSRVTLMSIPEEGPKDIAGMLVIYLLTPPISDRNYVCIRVVGQSDVSSIADELKASVQVASTYL